MRVAGCRLQTAVRYYAMPRVTRWLGRHAVGLLIGSRPIGCEVVNFKKKLIQCILFLSFSRSLYIVPAIGPTNPPAMGTTLDKRLKKISTNVLHSSCFNFFLLRYVFSHVIFLLELCNIYEAHWIGYG